MVDMVTYKFADLETGIITPEDFFMNAYTKEVHELEQVRTSTKQLYVILYSKY